MNPGGMMASQEGTKTRRIEDLGTTKNYSQVPWQRCAKLDWPATQSTYV